MGKVKFNKSSTLAQALSSTDSDKIFFPTNSSSIVINKKEFGSGTYKKPSTGIPESDLAQGVKEKLDNNAKFIYASIENGKNYAQVFDIDSTLSFDNLFSNNVILTIIDVTRTNYNVVTYVPLSISIQLGDGGTTLIKAVMGGSYVSTYDKNLRYLRAEINDQSELLTAKFYSSTFYKESNYNTNIGSW